MLISSCFLSEVRLFQMLLLLTCVTKIAMAFRGKLSESGDHFCVRPACDEFLRNEGLAADAMQGRGSPFCGGAGSENAQCVHARDFARHDGLVADEDQLTL
jgi:hypothetical protein